MNINYELYKVFYLTAEHMSFSKAAHDLFVTQSSVSQSIKSLEEQMNVSLFFRNGKRISLTTSGQILFEHLSSAFNDIKRAENLINSYKSLEVGELKIGASDTICKHYLLEIFEEFHSLYPSIKLLIDNQPSPKTKLEVINGQLDIGFINHEVGDLDKRFNSIDFYTLDEIFFFSSHHEKLKNIILSPEDFNHHSFISLKKNTSTRNFIKSIFDQFNIALEPEIELISIDLIVDLVSIGLGIGFADRRVIENHVPDNLIELKTNFDIPKRRISLISNSRAPLSNAANAFIKIAQKKASTK